MMAYIDIQSVRTAGGFPDDLISDDQIRHAIQIVEEQAERFMGTYFSPRLKIDYLDGTGENYLFTNRNPVLRVDYIESNEVSISPEDVVISRESGKITLKRTASTSSFLGVPEGVIIQYWTAYLLPNDDYKHVDDDVDKGSDVEIELDNTSNLLVGDWVQFQSRTGYTSAKITNINYSTQKITVDKLVVDIKENTIVNKLILPTYLKRLIELESTIYLAINAVGATYVFNAGYSIPEFSVQKGVPYTHWKESIEKAIRERDTLMKTIKPRFIIR